MKKTILKSLLIAATCFGAVAAQAQTAPKIMTVDIAKVYAGYYMTPKNISVINGEVAKSKAMIDSLQKTAQDSFDVLKGVVEKYNKATEAEKPKLLEDANVKNDALKVQQAAIQQTVNDKQQAIQQQANVLRADAMKDILAAAQDVAKQKGASVLLDKSANSLSGVPSVVYLASTVTDISDDVIAALNKGHEVTSTPAVIVPMPASK